MYCRRIQMVAVLSFIVHSCFYIMVVFSYGFFPDEATKNFNRSVKNSVPLPSDEYEINIRHAPHHVLVYYSRLYCSGSIVSSRAAVTCAACFYGRANETVYVKAGAQLYTDYKIGKIRALEVKIHEYYRRISPVDNDIALLFLETHVKLSPTVMKIPLMQSGVSLRLKQTLIVTGYAGDNIAARLKNHLIATPMILTSNKECEVIFGQVMTYSNYCAKLLHSNQLLSDSGGGATKNNILVGILTNGARSDKMQAAIFTNVSYFHRWIVLNLARYHEQYCNEHTDSITIDVYDK